MARMVMNRNRIKPLIKNPFCRPIPNHLYPPVFFPFLGWWHEVNEKTIKADLLAGLTGAVIVLPQGVAFAMIAGLPPIYGLYTAMVTPIVAAFFGSSKHLVSGPTTAISLVVFATVGQLAEPGSEQFIEYALAITLMAGLFQLALGLGRLGVLINFCFPCSCCGVHGRGPLY